MNVICRKSKLHLDLMVSINYYQKNRLGLFLAHLIRRLIGELIVYPCSGVLCRLSFTMLKHLLLNRLTNQSQIFCGASIGRGNESLFAAYGSAYGSHDQDGRHANTCIW